jgi:hypothetical protein
MKQTMHGNGSGLTTAIGSGGRLIFDRRIPFKVVVDDVICCGDIESGASSFRIQYQRSRCHDPGEAVNDRLAFNYLRPPWG